MCEAKSPSTPLEKGEVKEALMARVSVIGAGAFGSALAHQFALSGHDVYLWTRDPYVADYISKHRSHPRRLHGIQLHPSLKVTSSFALAASVGDIIVSALPMSALGSVWSANANALSSSSYLVSTTKGVEKETHAISHEVFLRIFGENIVSRLGVLSGPSFAKEVALGLPTAVTIACQDEATSQKLARTLQSTNFRVHPTTDVMGSEICGAFKNIIAIAAGLVEGLQLGHNALADLMVLGLSEMSQIVAALGGDTQTAYGLCGLGDLFLTCTGQLSRNRQVGHELGKGFHLEEVLKHMPEHPEGVYTALSIPYFATRYSLKLPIMTSVYEIVHQGKSPSGLAQVFA
jgi:glycerol-3-phosphate dehydrogenase (NAD(P)+)